LADAGAAITNSTSIGSGAVVTDSNSIMLGNSNVTSIKIDSNGAVDLGTAVQRFSNLYTNSINTPDISPDDTLYASVYSTSSTDKHSDITLSNNNRTATFGSSLTTKNVFTNYTFNSAGTEELTFSINLLPVHVLYVGISSYVGNTTIKKTNVSGSYAWLQNGDQFVNGNPGSTLDTFTTGDIIRLVVQSNTFTIYKNGILVLDSLAIVQSSNFRFMTGDNSEISATAEVEILPFKKIEINADLNLNGSMYYNGDTSGYVLIKAASTTNTHEYQLPDTQGTANTTLTNNGSGNLYWGSKDYAFVATTNTTYSGVAQSVSLGVINTNTEPDFYDLVSNHQNDALNGMTYTSGITSTNASGGTKTYCINGQISIQADVTVRFFVGITIDGVFQKNGASRIITQSLNIGRSTSFSGIYIIDQNKEIKLSLAVTFSNSENLNVYRYSYNVIQIA
jgi:hypothetical protein